MNRKHIKAEDDRLEKEEGKASEALQEYRWHWTLDESNPERMSIRAYAILVGKANSTIQQYVHMYQERVLAISRPEAPVTPGGYAGVKYSWDRRICIDAVASAIRKKFQTAAKKTDLVNTVLQLTQDALELNPSLKFEAEAQRIAKEQVAREKEIKAADEALNQQAKAAVINGTFRYDLCAKLSANAYHVIQEMVDPSKNDWDDTEREGLIASWSQVAELLGVVMQNLKGGNRKLAGKIFKVVSGD